MTRSAPPDPGDAELSVGQPAAAAAGVKGVLHGLAPVVRQVGVRRGWKVLRHLNQQGGIDCPGCAWPEPEHPSVAEFCENGAKAVAEEGTKRAVGARFFARHSIADLAGRSDYWLGQQGRLVEPMYRRPHGSHYEPIGWDAAFGVIARHLQATSPDRAVFYTSGRTSNEAAFLYQLFVREYGTNNLPDCSNMCHESSGVALGETIGIGKGSVTLADFDHADLIMVVGQNPGTNHPRMLTTLERAKDRGAAIVAINPLPEAGLLAFKNPQRVKGLVGAGTTLADAFLQIRVGGDHALFQLINAALVERGAVDDVFVDEHTDGFEELAGALAAVDRGALLRATGLTASEVDDLTERVARTDRIIVCWAMGLTQHKHAVATIQEIVNTVLLRGALGLPGAGLCPVRGHSNVQGDRTMGIYEKPEATFLDALDAEFGITAPRRPGYDTVDAIAAMERGEVDAFLAMGGNFMAATPDTDRTGRTMARCPLTVQVSTKLNRSHAVCGTEALILPALGRSDIDRTGGLAQFVTVEDSMSEVHASAGSVEPLSAGMRSEVSVICDLAQATLPTSTVPWADFATDYSRIRARIERVIPGFEAFDARVRHGGRFRLPHPPRDRSEFATASGKARFSVHPVTPIEIPTGRLLLQTVRSHDQYNTTIYGLDDRYRGIRSGRRVVFCHPDDLADLGIADAAVVDLVSEWSDGTERRAERFRVVAYPTAQRTAAAYFPEANSLVPLESVADGSNTPTSKAVIIRLEPRR